MTGRPSDTNALRLGVDLGGTKIEIVALAADGTERLRRRVPTPAGDYGATVAAIARLVAEAEDRLGAEASIAAGIGVGIPGTISPATGVVKNANSTWLNGRPLATDLQAALARPVRIANDANCFVLSEATDGAAAGVEVAFGVIVGTGVGGGIAVAGAALRGANAIAGEWGHNPLPWPKEREWPGPACWCGRTGCTETFLSGAGLSRDHAARGNDAASAEAIAAAAAAGDGPSAESVARYADRLARALAAVVNLVDPDVVVLGGGLSQIAALYDLVPRLWRAYVFSDRVDTRLVPPCHGDSSGVRGAARLWSPGESLP